MSSLRLYDGSDALTGYLEGASTWTPPLDRLQTLSVHAPVMWEGVNQLTLVETAVSVSHEGHRYLIQSYSTDEVSYVSMECESRAVELSHYPASLTTAPAVYHGIPSAIFTDALADYTRVRYPNGDFSQAGEEIVGAPGYAYADGWDRLKYSDSTIWDAVVVKLSAGYGYSGFAPPGYKLRPLLRDLIPVPPGTRFKVQFDYQNAIAAAHSWQYYPVSGSVVGARISFTLLPTTSGAWSTYTSGWITAQGDAPYIAFGNMSATDTLYVDNIYLLIESDDCPWSCVSSSYDTRTAAEREIRIGDPKVTLDENWTTGADYLTAAAVANAYFRMTGGKITFYWSATAAPGWIETYVDDVMVGASVGTGTAAGSATRTWADYGIEHTVRLRCSSGAFLGQSGKLVDTDAPRTLSIEASGSLMDVLRAVQAQSGGEYSFDSEARTFTHTTVGANLRSVDVMYDLSPFLIEGSISRTHQQAERYDKVMLIGADGVAAYATAGTPFGQPKWLRIDDSSVVTRTQAERLAQTWADYYSGDQIAYECAVTEEGAALIAPGDTVRLPLATPVEVRVLEISRSSESGEATLKLAVRRQSGVEGLVSEIGRI